MLKLNEMTSGQTGIVRRIEGGKGMVRRLHAIGIREGKTVKKVSAQFWRGPVTIELEFRQFSIGNGMAGRIFVEPTEVQA